MKAPHSHAGCLPVPLQLPLLTPVEPDPVSKPGHNSWDISPEVKVEVQATPILTQLNFAD